MKLILASNNKNKIKEYKELLGPYGYEIITMKEAGINSDPEETGSIYEENARIKAKAVWDIVHEPVIADDSGLEIDALDGQPGLYTKRFAEPGKHCEKILSMMEGIPTKDRTARLICAICYIGNDGKLFVARGTCNGIISESVRGESDTYCYQILMCGDKTLAELPANERNELSHRAKAAKCFADLVHKI